MSQKYDIVITSGGIGPTHDDVTLKAISTALGQDLMVNNIMLEHLKEIYTSNNISYHNNESITEEMRRLSILPEFSQLHFPPSPDDYLTTKKGETIVTTKSWPILQCDNIFVLPGIPKFFASKMNLITKYFLTKYKLLEIRKIVLDLEERNLVNILNLLVKSNPDVKFGSYPFIDHPDFKTIITVEGYNEEKVDDAVTLLLESLPSNSILRVEKGSQHKESK